MPWGLRQEANDEKMEIGRSLIAVVQLKDRPSMTTMSDMHDTVTDIADVKGASMAPDLAI